MMPYCFNLIKLHPHVYCIDKYTNQNKEDHVLEWDGWDRIRRGHVILIFPIVFHSGLPPVILLNMKIENLPTESTMKHAKANSAPKTQKNTNIPIGTQRTWQMLYQV